MQTFIIIHAINNPPAVILSAVARTQYGQNKHRSMRIVDSYDAPKTSYPAIHNMIENTVVVHAPAGRSHQGFCAFRNPR